MIEWNPDYEGTVDALLAYAKDLDHQAKKIEDVWGDERTWGEADGLRFAANGIRDVIKEHLGDEK